MTHKGMGGRNKRHEDVFMAPILISSIASVVDGDDEVAGMLVESVNCLLKEKQMCYMVFRIKEIIKK